MGNTPYPRSDRELLQRISRSTGGKAGYKQLIRELGLGGGRERRLLLEQLTRMVARGELQRNENGQWLLPRSEGSTADAYTRPGAAGGRNASGHEGRERLVSGRLDLHRDGFGFVRPEPGSGTGSASSGDLFIPPGELNGAMQGDLVLVDEAPPGRDGRRSGRIARVLTRRNPTVVGIFHYAKPQARGHGDERFGLGSPRGNYVTPMDERVASFIEIPEGAEIPAAAADSPHRTLGDEARRKNERSGLRPQTPDSTASESSEVSKSSNGSQNQSRVQDQRSPVSSGLSALSPESLEGFAVDVELTHFPAAGKPARGRVLEVLGRPEDFGVDVEIVIRKHHLPHVFPPAVLAEAATRSELTVARLAAEEPEEFGLREDFRGLPIVTIDGETARDFDDAVCLRPLANGNTELQVHIADVSAYVLAGSLLDTEARVRGTSVYFPDRAVPMLPGALSSGVCSLRPEEDRLVLSCVMEVDPHGEILGYRVAEGVIRSVRRCTYTSVQQCLNASPSAQQWNETHIPFGDDDQKGRGKAAQPVTPEPTAEDLAERERVGLEQPEMPAAFDHMLELALQLNAKRVRRGSIDFDLPEPVIEFDPDGNMQAIVRSERGWAHRLIEEFMLSANECVATWLAAQSIPSIYRIHELPDPKRILEFEEFAAGFGYELGVGAIPTKRLTMKSDRREAQRRSARGRERGSVAAHEVPSSIAVTPQMYQRLVRRIAGRPEERILSYMMLRSLKQARYAEKNEGHFALASPCYTHFTSPIRRYPDLIVHRLVRGMLRGGAEVSGGALLSTDKQPWAGQGSGLRAEPGSGARAQRPEKVGSRTTLPQQALHQALRVSTVPEKLNGPRERKRAGRVGWSDESDTTSAISSGMESRSSEAALLQSTEPPSGPWAMDPGPLDPGPLDPGPLHPGLSSIEPLSDAELNDIAVESSQAERRAADAERELIEWKKMRFMADKVGDDFGAIILSVTKYGFFVELDEMFIEGMVPLGSLVGDHYAFRETDRSICGARTGHCFAAGQRVAVILDRIDRQTRRLQFALLPGTEPQPNTGINPVRAGMRAGKSEKKKLKAAETKGAKKAKQKKR